MTRTFASSLVKFEKLKEGYKPANIKMSKWAISIFEAWEAACENVDEQRRVDTVTCGAA